MILSRNNGIHRIREKIAIRAQVNKDRMKIRWREMPLLLQTRYLSEYSVVLKSGENRLKGIID